MPRSYYVVELGKRTAEESKAAGLGPDDLFTDYDHPEVPPIRHRDLLRKLIGKLRRGRTSKAYLVTTSLDAAERQPHGRIVRVVQADSFDEADRVPASLIERRLRETGRVRKFRRFRREPDAGTPNSPEVVGK